MLSLHPKALARRGDIATTLKHHEAVAHCSPFCLQTPGEFWKKQGQSPPPFLFPSPPSGQPHHLHTRSRGNEKRTH